MALKREFLSTNEVAEVLGISPFTVRRYIQLRKLRAVKLEGSYRVRQTALDDFLQARELETEEELAAMESEDDNKVETKKESPRRAVKPVEPAKPAAKKSERPQSIKQTQDEPRSSSKKSARVQRGRHEK